MVKIITTRVITTSKTQPAAMAYAIWARRWTALLIAGRMVMVITTRVTIALPAVTGIITRIHAVAKSSTYLTAKNVFLTARAMRIGMKVNRNAYPSKMAAMTAAVRITTPAALYAVMASAIRLNTACAVIAAGAATAHATPASRQAALMIA